MWGKTFSDQLYESTARRIKKQREAETRFADLTDDAPSSQFFFTTFCEQPPFLVGPVADAELAFVSVAILAFIAGSRRPELLSPNSTTSLKSIPKDRPRLNTAPTNMEAAWTDLMLIVGEDNMSTEKNDLQAHSGSEWSSYTTKEDEHPFMIVLPATTEEVSEIMKICHRRRIPVTAYSGGTSLEGHFATTRGGVCIDFSRMDKILGLHKEDLDVVVQPAVGWESLNEELAKDGLFFPPDPGPGAMIGGMVGTGCSGTNAYRYGTMREWVISLTVVLADGTVVKTRQRPRKSSAGYDLTRVFIGSEGTLGLVTEATLKVTVKPKSESVAVTSFGTIREAAECVSRVVSEGIPIAAVELLDDVQMRCINESGSTSKSWKEAPTLFFKFSGTPSAVKESIGLVQKQAKKSKSFDFAKDADEAAELWSARKEALWSVMAKRRDEKDHVWTTDVAVPMSRLPAIIEQTKEDMASSGLLAAMVGHVGDGNFHAIILFNDKERKKAEAVVHRMVKRAVEMEGTVTGEHGVGLIKRDYLPHELGQSTVDLMRKVSVSPHCKPTILQIFTNRPDEASLRSVLYTEL